MCQKTISFRLDPSTYDVLSRAADDHDWSISHLVRNLVEATAVSYLECLDSSYDHSDISMERIREGISSLTLYELSLLCNIYDRVLGKEV